MKFATCGFVKIQYILGIYYGIQRDLYAVLKKHGRNSPELVFNREKKSCIRERKQQTIAQTKDLCISFLPVAAGEYLGKKIS